MLRLPVSFSVCYSCRQRLISSLASATNQPSRLTYQNCLEYAIGGQLQAQNDCVNAFTLASPGEAILMVPARFKVLEE
jgi:hypothetical protein